MSDEEIVPIAAASKVFAIPELLERIILRIPQYGVNVAPSIKLAACVAEGVTYPKIHCQQIRPILRAQGVSKAFYNTIRGSKACMSAVFREHVFKYPNHTEYHLARFNPIFLGILKLESTTFRVCTGGDRMDYVISTQYEHFAGLRRELERIEKQAAGGGCWQDAFVCNMPAVVSITLQVTSGRICEVHAGPLRRPRTVKEALQVFVHDTRNLMKGFERQLGRQK